MKPKSIITVLLLVFVFGSLAYRVLLELCPDEVDAEIEAEPTTIADLFEVSSGQVPEIVVVYFYDEKVCSTCIKLKGYAEAALDSHFPHELADGFIKWTSLDMQQPGNKHFVTEFGLYSKSVVLLGYDENGAPRWKNLEQIWDLVYNKEAYIEYIYDEINQFLEGGASTGGGA